MDGIPRRGPDSNSRPHRQDQLRLLQEHLASLRKETEGWLERQARVWQTVIAGVAAVVVLSDDTEIEAFLPLAPILAMGVLAQWLSLLRMVFRVGHAMSVDEFRINQLVGGSTLLSHEIRLWDKRSERLDWLHDHVPLITLGSVLVGGLYGAALVWLLLGTADPSIAPAVIYGAAGAIALGLAIANLVRIFWLNRDLKPPSTVVREDEQGNPPPSR